MQKWIVLEHEAARNGISFSFTDETIEWNSYLVLGYIWKIVLEDSMIFFAKYLRTWGGPHAFSKAEERKERLWLCPSIFQLLEYEYTNPQDQIHNVLFWYNQIT